MRILLALVSSAAVMACSVRSVPVPSPPTTTITVSDGRTVTLQVDPDRGGAIVSARAIDQDVLSPQMVDNTSPTGRQWQAAFWKGINQPCSDGDLCNHLCAGALNPTQAGDSCERRSGGTVLASTMLTPRFQAIVNSTPLDFSASSRRPLHLQAAVTIVADGVVRLDYHVHNISDQPFGDDAWQNLPVLFTPLEYSIVTSYLPNGSLVHPDRQLESVTDDQWRGWSPEWVARSSADGWTVLLYVPGTHPWSVGFPGAQSPGAGWMQSLIWQELQPGESATSTAWIVVGRTLEQCLARMKGLR